MKCSVNECDRKYYAKGFCNRHYQQFKSRGKIIISNKRTPNDPNEFIIDGDICWVIIYSKYCIEIARSKIDTKYYQQIRDSELKWHLLYGYVSAFWKDIEDKRYNTFLHGAIIQLSGQEVSEGYEIDHFDGDKLNNLEENLRICKHCENTRNRGKQINNTSGQKGVFWNKNTNDWESNITVNYIHIPLGHFSTIEDAARAYNEAAIIYHGEFAVLNTI